MAHGPRLNITQPNANNALVVTQNGNAIAMTIDSDATSNQPISIIPVNANSRGDIAFGTVRTSDASSPSEGDWWFNATTPGFKFHDGVATRTMLSNTLNTLQQAYTGGRTITITTGLSKVLLTVPDTVSSAAGLTVISSSTAGSTSTGDTMRITRNSTAGSGGVGLFIETPSITGNDHVLLDMRRAGTGQTSAQGWRYHWGNASPGFSASNVLRFDVVNTNFAIPAIDIDCSTRTGSSAIGLVDLVCAGNNNRVGFDLTHQIGSNVGTCLKLEQSATGSTGAFCILVQDSSQMASVEVSKLGNGTVLDINKTPTGASDIIDIQNEGTGTAIQISHTTGTGVAISIDKSHSGNANIIDINSSGGGHDIEGHADLWRVDRRGHAQISSTVSKLVTNLNSSNFSGITKWQQMAMDSAQGAASVDSAYSGVTFDGRYVYFTALDSDTFIRYDTTKSFSNITSWEPMAVSSAQGNTVEATNSYQGTVCDGRYVYFAPRNSDTFIRFDTQKSFTAITSWQQIAMNSAQGNTAVDDAYSGATFDGKYIYYTARNSDTFVRYDTTLSFTAIASWAQIAMSSAQGGAAVDQGFVGTTFDGRYVYFVASDSDTFVRFDTNSTSGANPFTNAGNWGQMRMASAQGGAALDSAYLGATSDSRYVYFAPLNGDTFIRFDTTLAFTVLSAWLQIAMSSAQGAAAADQAYAGITFDGRYTYLAPLDSDTFVRYDTTATFTSISSWNQLAMSSALGATATDDASLGVTFDGRYIYFAAHSSDTFVRLLANNGSQAMTAEYAQVSSV